MIGRLEKLTDFFERRELKFLRRVVEEVGRVEGKSVLYAGSGGDVEHAVILGNDLVFVDSHLPEVTLSEIRRKIVDMGGKILRELSIGRKYVIEFDLLGEVKLTYFADDIVNVLRNPPEELRRGIAVYFVKVPHPKEPNVSDLTSPEVLSKALSMIILNGYYLERECPLPNPESVGFEKVASGYISALSIRNVEGNLYKKVRRLSEEKIMSYLSDARCRL